MRIIISDTICTIENPRSVPEVLSITRTICRARPSGYHFMARYKSGQWDGYISLMTGLSTFPTGLLDIVVKAISERGYAIELVKPKCDGANPITDSILTGVTLRDYQVEAANVMLSKRRGVIKMATNSGKTEVAAAVIKAIGGKAVVLVHRKELMYQTAQRFMDRGLEDVGMVGDGIHDPKTITIAMIQTLDNRLTWAAEVFKDNKVLIIDECHHLSSRTAEEVFNVIPGSYRFGMSGTPIVHDVLSDMKLMAATGDVIYELTNSTMINAGYSARPIINIKVVDGIDGDDNWGMEYQEAYKALIVCNEKRNGFIADYAKQQTGVVLIMVNQLDHGETLKGMIPNSIFVHGSDTTEVRQWTLETMKVTSGVYIASPIFDEGVDVPSIDCVIFAGGGISHVRLLQRIGRGLRKKVGDNILRVLDFIDDTNKHLLGHSDVRISTYISEGFETNII